MVFSDLQSMWKLKKVNESGLSSSAAADSRRMADHLSRRSENRMLSFHVVGL